MVRLASGLPNTAFPTATVNGTLNYVGIFPLEIARLSESLVQCTAAFLCRIQQYSVYGLGISHHWIHPPPGSSHQGINSESIKPACAKNAIRGYACRTLTPPASRIAYSPSYLLQTQLLLRAPMQRCYISESCEPGRTSRNVSQIALRYPTWTFNNASVSVNISLP